jgi:hypothetical protein
MRSLAREPDQVATAKKPNKASEPTARKKKTATSGLANSPISFSPSPGMTRGRRLRFQFLFGGPPEPTHSCGRLSLGTPEKNATLSAKALSEMV